MIELIQTILLCILVDRQLIIRNRYKFAIESRMDKIPPSWAFWIYCKRPGDEVYWRSGGKRLIFIKFKDKKS